MSKNKCQRSKTNPTLFWGFKSEQYQNNLSKFCFRPTKNNLCRQFPIEIKDEYIRTCKIFSENKAPKKGPINNYQDLLRNYQMMKIFTEYFTLLLHNVNAKSTSKRHTNRLSMTWHAKKAAKKNTFLVTFRIETANRRLLALNACKRLNQLMHDFCDSK